MSLKEYLESYSIIWLDESEKNLIIQQQLRSINSCLILFDNELKCLDYIKSILKKDNRIILIVNERLGEILVPKINDYQQIFSIYIYGLDEKPNEQWIKQFNKIKGVITDSNELISRIKHDHSQQDESEIDETVLSYIINLNNPDQGHSTSDITEDFLHSQLLIDCLINMESHTNDKQEFISLCKQQYADDINQLNIINEFEKEYSSTNALWWYTRDSFIYRILNKVLRIQNLDLLYLLRFFIRDIHQQLEEIRCLQPIRVYRAQLMSKNQVEILTNSLGEYLAFNCFLSTCLDYQQTQSLFLSQQTFHDIERVYFEIDADPQIENIKSFSDISLYSYYPQEKEVLFMIGSIFRLIDIHRDQQGILIVQMKLSSINEHYLKRMYLNMHRKYISEQTTLVDFSNILVHMGKLNLAEKYYQIYLNQLSESKIQIASCYQGLGIIEMKKQNYDSSLKLHTKSLKIKMRSLEPDHPSIATSYISIGNVYHKQNDYIHALKSYRKAFKIYRRLYGEDDLNIAVCINCMGNSYRRQQEFSKALELYHHALLIQEKYLPHDHPDLGIAHNNIGNTQADLGYYDLALAHYNFALKIYKKSSRTNHPSIALTLRNIALIYEEKNDFQQALGYYEKAANIFRCLLPLTHPSVIQIENDISRISACL